GFWLGIGGMVTDGDDGEVVVD
ncbi:hypothetical protein A2U01_0099576, partial [Trifolium medium]|nr:hypothetical protein [Trifolium medium]